MCLSIQAFTKMKMAQFWFLVMLAHAVLLFLSVIGSSDHDLDKFSPISEDSAAAATSNRELMEGCNTIRKINKNNMKLDDYSPIDPVPGSSASVTSGPIEHGTPLLPYIPKLSPPDQPPNVDSRFPPAPA